MADPTIVQDAKVDPAVGASVVIVLGGAPTTGNILIAAINFGLFGSARTTSPPGGAGWALKAPTGTAARTTNNAQDIYWKHCTGGEGTSHTFTISEGSEFCSGLMWEIVDADTTDPFNAINAAVGTTTSLAMAALTPSVMGCRPLSAHTQDNNGAATTTVSAPWAVDNTAASASGRGGNIASRGITTDTTTAITGTWTLVSSTETIATNMLIQPVQGGGGGGGTMLMAVALSAGLRPAPFKPGTAR